MKQASGFLVLGAMLIGGVAMLHGCVVGAQRPGVRADGQSEPPRPTESPGPPPAASGWAWEPGYWHYDGSQPVWVPGRWVEASSPLDLPP